MHQNLADHSLDFGLHQRSPPGRDHGVAVNAKRQRANHQEEQGNGPQREEQRAPALLHGHEFPLADQHWFQNGDKGHFLVHLGVAQRDSGLTRKNFENFDVRRPQKIGIAALHGVKAHAAGVVIQRPGVKAAHPRISEVFLEFGSRLLAVAVNLLAMLADV